MKNIKIKILGLFVLLLGLLADITNCGASDIPENILFAGTSKVIITPETPIPMSGYGGRKDPFKGVHDDLYVRVVVFSDGVNKAALITADVIGFSHSFWEETTQLITKETGIRQEYIFLTAVHNHGGPVTKVYSKDTSKEVNAYVYELMNKIVVATKEADNNLIPVRIGAGRGECRMNINRRAPDGKGGVSLGQNPYAPCDHEVGVITIDDKSGKHLAVIMNWPCHGVVLGPKNYLITGDWPGAASRYIEEGSDGKIIAPVIVGASGDINPIYGPHIDFEENSSYSYGKEAIGEDLGKESLRIIKSIQTFSTGKIVASQRVIQLEAKEKANDNLQRPENKEDNFLSVRLSALKIGPIVLTGVSGEVFNQISVKMRSQSPYTNTFMVTHCNGSSGYLVSEDAYPEAGVTKSEDKFIPVGGYEVNSTKAKSGAEKAIIENLLDMINEL